MVRFFNVDDDNIIKKIFFLITHNVILYFCDCTGTKNVGRTLKKITEGPVRERGVSWFPELVDKRMYMTMF